MKRACLSGKDVCDLVEGKIIVAFGVEFAYDGSGLAEIMEALKKKVPQPMVKEFRSAGKIQVLPPISGDEGKGDVDPH